MAKRKRLSPAVFSGADEIPAGLETKSAPPIAGVARDAAATAALNEMADTLREARETGRMVLELSLSEIKQDHLVRDRVALDTDALSELMTSLRARGQQTPIEVLALPGGGYGLISGWRRCQALARLAEEDRQEAKVLALLRQPQDVSDAYQAMVEENEIRVGLSYYERARVALKSVQEGVFESEKAAIQRLFQGASPAKWSKIGSFVGVVRALDGVLRHPAAVPERLGLTLARALAEDDDLAPRLVASLEGLSPATLDAERAAIEQALLDSAAPKAPKKRPAPKPEQRQLRPGLYVTQARNGDLTLSGKGLTADLRARLEAWLVDNG